MSHYKGEFESKRGLCVIVRDNNIESAIKVLGRKVKRDGVLTEVMKNQYYEQPSVKRRREKNEAIARQIKANRKKDQG
jgi:small subunit ribosomal protein S21